ncbi:MAG TPA: SDR family NAD(P)-dependent oxidoreductase [Terriglobales bacterium]|nr:SDR family NAD(P)-dependent oxidoreductase [Terriglobales bacterium]
MELAGKVVVITGASMGIGEALAKVFADHGASVVLSSRDAGRAEAARQRIGHLERTLALACDVRRREDIDRLVAAVLERFGRIDVWINNAGHGLIDSIATMDMAACRSMFDTNLFGAVECMQAVVPWMKKQRSGAIINISSVAGHIAVPYRGAYSATKFALNAIGRTARIELRGTGINVLTVCPGYIATDFAVNAIKGRERMRLGTAARQGIPAERVARAVLDAYKNGKREIVVPWKDHLLIKIYQCFPRLLEYVMARLLRPADEVIAKALAARKGS